MSEEYCDLAVYLKKQFKLQINKLPVGATLKFKLEIEGLDTIIFTITSVQEEKLELNVQETI